MPRQHARQGTAGSGKACGCWVDRRRKGPVQKRGRPGRSQPKVAVYGASKGAAQGSEDVTGFRATGPRRSSRGAGKGGGRAQLPSQEDPHRLLPAVPAMDGTLP